jgi:glycosyltransferase involved in cell wall biosynthesis
VFPGYFDSVFFFISIYLKLKRNRFSVIGIDNNLDEPVSNIDKLKLSFKKVLCAPYDGVMTYVDKPSFTLKKLLNKKEILTGVSCVNEKNIIEVNNSKNDIPVITFIGRLTENKGISRLCKIIDLFEEHNFDTKYNIVGNGELSKCLYEKYADSSNIILHGGVDSKTVYKIISESSCLILPSLYEPWGLVVSESLLSGVPVIVSKEVGARELVIEGVNGSVVDFDDESIYEKFRDLVISLTKFDSSKIIESASSKKTEIVSIKISNYFKRLLEQ